jgi:NADH-quinone oxidoreductase subunit L
MTRACVKTFWGEYKGHGTPHESPGAMVTPLWILAIASMTVGFLGFPIIGPFQDWITVPGELHPGFSTLYNIIVPVGSIAIAVLAIWLGWQLWERNRWQYRITDGPFAWAYRFVENKYYLDDLYLNYIVRPVQYSWAKAAYWTNQNILDGAVNGVAKGTVALASGTYVFDQQVVDYAINGAAGITGWTGGLLRYVQSGNVQRYAAILFLSVAAFVAIFVIA